MRLQFSAPVVGGTAGDLVETAAQESRTLPAAFLIWTKAQSGPVAPWRKARVSPKARVLPASQARLAGLGSVWQDRKSYRNKPCLYEASEGRYLDLHWWDDGWYTYTRFAATHK